MKKQLKLHILMLILGLVISTVGSSFLQEGSVLVSGVGTIISFLATARIVEYIATKDNDNNNK